LTFIIKTPQDKIRAIDFIRDMPLSPVQSVVIKKYKRNRSLAQNNTFHDWAELIADVSGYSPDEVKDKLVLSLWPPVQRTVEVKNKSGVSRYTMIERRSTKEMTVEEMTLLLNATAQIAHTLGVKLPYDDAFLDSMGK